MRVLAVSSYGVLGGAELALLDFVRSRPAGVEVEVVCVTDGPLRAQLAAEGVPVWAGDHAGRPTARSVARFGRAFGQLLDRRSPDVVWAIGAKAALLAAGSCRLRGVPLVWHKVDFSWDSLLARPLALAASGVIGVSEAVTEALGPLRERRVLGVVWPPIRLGEDLRSRPDAERPVIGTLARLAPYKGQHHIVRAAALLVPEFPRLRVLLAGGRVSEYPDYPEQLEALARELGVYERVELTGHLDDVGAALARLTVFVGATYRDEHGFGFEGLGLGAIEASWAGVPVVVARGGGAAETLIDGRTGTLVETADPALLAAAIAPYLRDRELRERTGAAGREFARAAGVRPGEASARLFSLLARCGRMFDV